MKFNVKGMHCASCAALIKDSLTEHGARDVSFDAAKGVVEVSGNITEAKARQAIVHAGYEVLR